MDRRWTALAATVLTVPLIQIFVFSVIPDPFVGSFDKMGLFYKSGWRSIGYFLVLTVFSVTVPPALMYASLRSPSRRRSEQGPPRPFPYRLRCWSSFPCTAQG